MKISVLYHPYCISASGSRGAFIPRDTEEKARLYLERRQKNLKKPDQKQWIVETTYISREIDVL